MYSYNLGRVGWGYSGQGLFGTRRGYLGHSVLLIKLLLICLQEVCGIVCKGYSNTHAKFRFIDCMLHQGKRNLKYAVPNNPAFLVQFFLAMKELFLFNFSSAQC